MTSETNEDIARKLLLKDLTWFGRKDHIVLFCAWGSQIHAIPHVNTVPWREYRANTTVVLSAQQSCQLHALDLTWQEFYYPSVIGNALHGFFLGGCTTSRFHLQYLQLNKHFVSSSALRACGFQITQRLKRTFQLKWFKAEHVEVRAEGSLLLYLHTTARWYWV